MAKVKVSLRFPTVGKNSGDVISVDEDEAKALIANGSAVAVKSATPKPEKG